MMRPGIFAFAIFLSTLPMTAASADGVGRHPIVLAELQEESIPAQDLAAPASPAAAAPSPVVEGNPDSGDDSGDWQQVPAGKPTGAEQPATGEEQKAPANASPTPTYVPHGQPAEAEPPEVAPALDPGSLATPPPARDASLT